MTITKDFIADAIGAMGEDGHERDWEVVPTRHAKMFNETAPSLAGKLSGTRIGGLATMFNEKDQEAVEARDLFKKSARWADLAILVTASTAALLLISGGMQETLGSAGRWIVGIIGFIGIVSSSLGALWLSRIKQGQLARKWAKTRAKAEAKRLAYFKAVLEETAETADEQLLGLEYTRRFLLDNQIKYFKERGRLHASAGRTALNRSTTAVFLASSLTALAGLLAIVHPQLAMIAGLAVFASAFGTFAISQSKLNLDDQNADRYSKALDYLEMQRLDLDDCREKVASGDKNAISQFFEPVFVILEADHKAFLTDVELREFAIGKMEKRLDAATSSVNDQKDAGTS